MDEMDLQGIGVPSQRVAVFLDRFCRLCSVDKKSWRIIFLVPRRIKGMCQSSHARKEKPTRKGAYITEGKGKQKLQQCIICNQFKSAMNLLI